MNTRMWRLIFLVSLLPSVVVVVMRKFLCDRVLRQSVGHMATRNGRELAERILRKAGLEGEVEVVQKRRPGVVVQPPRLQLSPALMEARDVVSLGEVAEWTGLAIVAVQQPDLLRWRQWALRFGWAFPTFTLVVVVFAVAVAKVTVGIAGIIVLAALGLASGLSLASVMVESEAAKLAERLVDESHALPRMADGEEVGRCCRAMAFRHVVPGAIEWLMRDPRREARNSLEDQEG